ncbi:DNA topoisomerase 2 isoform X2 [Aegilops tauschii subsp. strangulata]|uniref:DNA topoisomerase 2 isoform X2 n=1 Tax=Aegilops tauschii subsp. strangulata TaxID=200361 RepID=UPI00098A5A59|nr:DNA topoisomerase 2 isoform X2 [Aegilops tauschii subsp. strangulata]
MRVGEWEICLTLSDGEFNQVSFTNGHSTLGGSHVDCVADQVIAYVMRNIEESGKQREITHENVKSWLWLFLNVTDENATFDLPCKETVTNSKVFTCKLSDEFLQKFIEFGIINILCPMGDPTIESDLSDSDVTGIPKLDDVKFAGGTKARKCTLILTEGDSAKLLVMNALGTIGRDYYGVYPLNGKIMNVNGRTPAQVWESSKVQTIMRIMGLKFERKYSVVDGLRYGRIMIMMDQDVDGSHIKGLIINLFLECWPSLLKVEGFLQQFITPIIRLSHNSESILFYSMIEYKLWNERHEGEAGNWTVKYYKGLGTSTTADAAKYFRHMRKHTRNFIWRGVEDSTSIKLAFDRKSAALRKEWMKIGFEFQYHMDYTQECISYSDFINNEMRLYSIANLERSTPSVMDGFKPVQRKIMHSCLKRTLKEVKDHWLDPSEQVHLATVKEKERRAKSLEQPDQAWARREAVVGLLPCGWRSRSGKKQMQMRRSRQAHLATLLCIREAAPNS